MRLKMSHVDPDLKAVIKKVRKSAFFTCTVNLRNKFIKFYSIKNKKIEKKEMWYK